MNWDAAIIGLAWVLAVSSCIGMLLVAWLPNFDEPTEQFQLRPDTRDAVEVTDQIEGLERSSDL
jgi:hypothetical protein